MVIGQKIVTATGSKTLVALAEHNHGHVTNAKASHGIHNMIAYLCIVRSITHGAWTS